MYPGNPTVRKIADVALIVVLTALCGFANRAVEGFWPTVGVYAVWLVGVLAFSWLSALAKRGQKASAEQ